MIVDRICKAARTTRECTEVRRNAFFRHERVIDETVKKAIWIGNGCIRYPGSRASIVYGLRAGVAKQTSWPTERSYVDELVVVVFFHLTLLFLSGRSSDDQQ